MKTYKILLLLLSSISVFGILFIWQYTFKPRRKIWLVKPAIILRNTTTDVLDKRVILAWNRFFGYTFWFWRPANKSSLSVRETCDKYECIFTIDKNLLKQSDMVLFHLRGSIPKLPSRTPKQIWAFVILEPPVKVRMTDDYRLQNVFNRSISYRLDSDLYFPYGSMTKITKQTTNSTVIPKIAQGKTKLVVWFISNCRAKERKKYGSELRRHLVIDVFGRCGKPDPCKRTKKCNLKMRQEYKFCIAFESIRCRDYITEKYWISVVSGCVPIVLGPSIENYNKMVPPDSFIHVDNFTSPEQLARYIKFLDQNDDAYHKYHMWRYKYHATDAWPSLCKVCSVLDTKEHFKEPFKLKEFWGRQNCNLKVQ